MEENNSKSKIGINVLACVGVGVLSALATSWLLGSQIEKKMNILADKLNSSTNISLSTEQITTKQTTKVDIPDKQAEKSLLMAKDSKNSNSLRSMYYINAITKNPDNIKVVKEYVDFMITSVASDSKDTKIKTYQMLLTYLSSLSIKVAPDSIADLEKLSNDVKNKLDVAIKETQDNDVAENVGTGTKPEGTVNAVDGAIKEWENIVSNINSNDISQLDTYITDVSDFINMYEDLKRDPKFKDIYATSKQTLSNLITSKQIADSVENIKRGIDVIEKEPNLDHALIEAQHLENELNALIAIKYKASQNMVNGITDLEQRMATLGSSLKQKVNAPVIDKIDQELSNIKVNEEGIEHEGECENAIKKVAELAKFLQDSQLDVDSKNKQAEKITKKITELRQIQSKKYNRWALSCINVAFDIIKENTNTVLRNEYDKIAAALYYIGDIDVTCLTYSVHNAYQTVFNYGYNGLEDNQQKIQVDSHMEDIKKKKLEDF